MQDEDDRTPQGIAQKIAEQNSKVETKRGDAQKGETPAQLRQRIRLRILGATTQTVSKWGLLLKMLIGLVCVSAILLALEMDLI